MRKKAKKRVIIGMSGGIDSSVAALLLKNEGYDVIGIFLYLWQKDREHDRSWNDAQKIAKILNMKIYKFNLAKEFKKEVVGYFLKETKLGSTPNPCIVCNEKIKFKFLFKKMLEMKADYMATGHYAGIKKIKGKFYLSSPLDEDKNQVYFLYPLKQKQLSRILFPLEKYKKTEIRKLAKKENLPVFEKSESQDICFIKEKNAADFIRKRIALSSGEIISENGKKLGLHEGLELYTIGQRKGINIGGTGPYYVIGRNFKNKQLIVTNNENDPAIHKKSMTVKIKNWLFTKPKVPLKTNVKIRYRNPLVRAIIKEIKGNLYKVEFKQPQKAITPGQSAVFYNDRKEVLGGGTIIS